MNAFRVLSCFALCNLKTRTANVSAQVVMEEYRNRFEKERTRLGLALQKTDACTKIISEVRFLNRDWYQQQKCVHSEDVKAGIPPPPPRRRKKISDHVNEIVSSLQP